MNGALEAYWLVDGEEERQRRNIALASSVNRKWPPRTEHDPWCTGGHPLTSYNGLVEYPCPR